MDKFLTIVENEKAALEELAKPQNKPLFNERLKKAVIQYLSKNPELFQVVISEENSRGAVLKVTLDQEIHIGCPLASWVNL